MPLTGSDILLYDKKDRIVTITLNRPERMNALTYELRHRLAEAWARFDEEEDAWVAILTGVGDKAFCVGADLKEEAEMKEKGIQHIDPPPYFGLEIWKPRIVAINGYALAGGFLLSMDCDIRIAAEHAEFGIPESRWNMPAYWVYPLSRYMTLGHALEFALWGDTRLSAQRCYEVGFINRVVPKDKLMEEAMSWAERMLSLGPRCVRNLKEMIYRGHNWTLQEGLRYGHAIEQNLKGMQDSIEGPMAFKENRKPNFEDR